MRRYEALQRIATCLTNELVVCNIGHPSQELFAIRDRAENFYMLGSMGLASSIGLGLALSSGRDVMVLDGDGAATMNLGSFATIAHNCPARLTHVIIDNAANGSTGFQPSFTAGALRLDAVARACGIGSVRVLTREDEIEPALRSCREAAGPHVLVIRTEVGMPDGVAAIPVGGVALRDRFMRTVRNRSTVT